MTDSRITFHPTSEMSPMEDKTITTLEELRLEFANHPDGTTCNVLSSDLNAGNFVTAFFTRPDGSKFAITYDGPVEEGYVSPFDRDDEAE